MSLYRPSARLGPGMGGNFLFLSIKKGTGWRQKDFLYSQKSDESLLDWTILIGYWWFPMAITNLSPKFTAVSKKLKRSTFCRKAMFHGKCQQQMLIVDTTFANPVAYLYWEIYKGLDLFELPFSISSSLLSPPQIHQTSASATRRLTPVHCWNQGRHFKLVL